MGMSLGSVVAAYFAEQRPELVERMILMGVMQNPEKLAHDFRRITQTYAGRPDGRVRPGGDSVSG